MRFKDDFSPTLKQLARTASPAIRRAILGHLANDQVNITKRNIAEEKNYDGTPMHSPATETKFGGRFAKSYNWRYRPGMALMTRKNKGRRRGEEMEGGTRVRRRIPVTPESRQLQDTGATIKSIDILSLSPYIAAVGPKTGHGQLVLEVHELRKAGSTRYPMGITDDWAAKAAQYAENELTKGVT